MKKPETNLQEYSKVELLLGIKDGDTFKIKGKSTSYQYNKVEGTIQDESGQDIDCTTILNIINHPEKIQNSSGESVNSYLLLNDICTKYACLLVVFGVLALSLIVILHTQLHFTFFTGIIMFLLAVCIAGSGFTTGVIMTKLLLNKELFL